MAKTCLVCNKLHLEMISIFRHQNELDSMLKFLLGLQAQEEDYLCKKCCNKVIDAFNSKQNIQQFNIPEHKILGSDGATVKIENDAGGQIEYEVASSNQSEVKIEHESDEEDMHAISEIVSDQIENKASWSESDVIIELVSDDLEDDVEVVNETADVDLESRLKLEPDADDEHRLTAQKIVGATAGHCTNETGRTSILPEGFNIVTLDACCKRCDSQNCNDYDCWDCWEYFEREKSVDIEENFDVEKYNNGRELVDIIPTLNSAREKEVLVGDRRKDPIVRCEVCHLPYRQITSYQNHVKRKHPDIYIKKCLQLDANWKVECHECGKRFRDTTKLGNHMRTHSGRGPLNCNQCLKICTSRSLYRKHLREHYVCCECDKGFTSFFNLQAHQKTHTEERPYSCSYCFKPFRSKYNHQMHVRMHTNERPYMCSACDKSFITSHRLKAHVRIHTGKRPYKCSYCSKTFINKYNRKIHEIVHTNDTPHVCCECDKGFVSGSKLRAHEKVHIKNPYKCCYCSKIFATKARRRIHEKKHKNEKP